MSENLRDFENELEIYSVEHLESLINSKGEINNDIIIRGHEIKSLGKVKKIYGCLGIDSNTIENLGDLEFVKVISIGSGTN